MTYAYRCKDCGKTFEIYATIEEKKAGIHPVCPRCKSKETSQVFGGFSIMTGSGGGSSGGFGGMPPGCGPGMGAGCCR
jgi:putative FmdB family regulatory protein